MARIKIQDYIKDVELNRRKLIDNILNNGKHILENASLSEAVSINNTLIPEDANINKFEVRFFDCDGTQIGESIWINSGESITPPPNPNYDPERLVFERWCSAIGDRFDNITHDIDYIANYQTKESKTHIFISLNDDTGYIIKLPLLMYRHSTNPIREANYIIDWGDGTQEESVFTLNNTSSSKTLTHTYSSAGDYEVVCTPSHQYYWDDTDTKNVFLCGIYPSYYGLLSRLDSANNIDLALKKVYTTTLDGWLSYAFNLEFIIYRHYYTANAGGGSRAMPARTFLMHDTDPKNYLSTGYSTYINKYTKLCIIDPTYKAYGASNIGTSVISDARLEKIIIPTNATRITGVSGYIKDIIVVGEGTQFVPTSLSLVGTKRLYFTGKIAPYQISSASYAYALKEIVYAPGSEIPTMQGLYSIEKFTFLPGTTMKNTSMFAYSYLLKEIHLYKDFNQSLSLSNSHLITVENVVEILNYVKDNTNDTVQTISFATALKLYLKETYVKDNNGFYEQCNKSDEGAILIAQAFANKNWTVSTNI